MSPEAVSQYNYSKRLEKFFALHSVRSKSLLFLQQASWSAARKGRMPHGVLQGQIQAAGGEWTHQGAQVRHDAAEVLAAQGAAAALVVLQTASRAPLWGRDS